MESMTTELLTPKDVEKILKCSLPQVYRLAKRGLIGVVRMPSAIEQGDRGLVRFRVSDVFEFIESNYKRPIHDTQCHTGNGDAIR